jgi:hypothetical protein
MQVLGGAGGGDRSSPNSTIDDVFDNSGA